jgi:hypothetical protein
MKSCAVVELEHHRQPDLSLLDYKTKSDAPSEMKTRVQTVVAKQRFKQNANKLTNESLISVC